MASLYERAGQRCRQNILKAYPAHRQAHLTEDEMLAFEAWKAANVEHLKALRDAIVAGEAPDIDRGWPELGEIVREPSVTVSEEPQHGAPPVDPPLPVAPEIIEVEKIVHVENPETQERLAEALRKLSEAEAKLEAKKAGTDIPPPEIADLIRLNENYERTNERLVTGYREAMQRAELARTRDGIFEGKSTTEWLRKADRYDSAIRWNKGRSAETI